MTQPNLRLLDRVSLVAALITPLLLMHAHGFAEASMGIASLCFLTRCGATGTWGWLRTPWMILSLVWCGWLAIASLHLPALGLEGGGPRVVGQALLSVRFPLFAAALALSPAGYAAALPANAGAGALTPGIANGRHSNQAPAPSSAHASTVSVQPQRQRLRTGTVPCRARVSPLGRRITCSSMWLPRHACRPIAFPRTGRTGYSL